MNAPREVWQGQVNNTLYRVVLGAVTFEDEASYVEGSDGDGYLAVERQDLDAMGQKMWSPVRKMSESVAVLSQALVDSDKLINNTVAQLMQPPTVEPAPVEGLSGEG